MTLHGRSTQGLESPDWYNLPFGDAKRAREAALSPVATREVILSQHQHIRDLLRVLEEKATRLLASSVVSPNDREDLRELSLVLCSVMASHIEFETRILAPVLTTLDAWGPVRAQELRDEHDQQLELLRAFAHALRQEPRSGPELARLAWQLVTLLRADMEQEEEHVLGASLLSDVAIADDVEAG